MKALLFGLLLLPPLCLAESGIGSHGATAQLRFRIVIPPVFRVLQATPVAGGVEYRVWTNMRSVLFQDRTVQFSKVGESTLRLPASNDLWLVHGL